MRDYIGIILVTVSVFRPGDSIHCRLEFEKHSVYRGESASLIYTPDDAVASVQWFKLEPASLTRLYPNKTSKSSTKYTELKTDEGFILIIIETELADAGYYATFCGKSWSPLAKLDVIDMEPAVASYPEFQNVEDIYYCSKCLPARLNIPMNITCFVKDESKTVELNMFKSEELLSSVYRSKDSKTNMITYGFVPTSDDFDAVFKCTVKNQVLQVEEFVTTKLYIKVDPESIDIKTQPTKENETSNVQCTTINGRPPITSLFYLNNNKQNSVNITKTIQSGYTYNVTTTLRRKLTRQDNHASVKCCSASSSDVCSNEEYLNVTFSPKSVVLTEISKVHKENGNTALVLKCDVDESNPKSFVIWKGVKGFPRQLLEGKYINHTATHGWTYTTTWMFNLTKEDRHRKIKCQVKNSEFPDLRLQQSYTPHITYSPVITISENGIKTVYIGDDVMLSCYVDSSPPSVITWYNETEKMEETNRTNRLDLHLVNVTTEHSQTYSCTARNGIGGTKSRDVTVTVKVKQSNVTTEHSQTYSYTARNGIGGTKSRDVTVTVKVEKSNVTTEHSQTYSYTARNGIGGTKSRDVTLTVKVELNQSEKSYSQPSNEVKSSSFVGAIIGGAVIISLTIVGVVVFLILWKKRKDKAPKGEGTQQITDEHRNDKFNTYMKERCKDMICQRCFGCNIYQEPLYKNLLALNETEVENTTEYECIDGTDHITHVYERLQNKEDKRVYVELDLNFDSGTAARRLHNVSQPKTETVKIETETV